MLETSTSGQWTLSYFPNIFANTSKNASKLLKIRDLVSIKGANQDKTCLMSNVPINPTQDFLVE